MPNHTQKDTWSCCPWDITAKTKAAGKRTGLDRLINQDTKPATVLSPVDDIKQDRWYCSWHILNTQYINQVATSGSY